MKFGFLEIKRSDIVFLILLIPTIYFFIGPLIVRPAPRPFPVFNARTKDTFTILSAGYQRTLKNIKNTKNLYEKDLVAYINYALIDTSHAFEVTKDGELLQGCSESFPCLRMHNGSILQLEASQQFNDSNKNALYFNVDPDAFSGYGGFSLVLYPNGDILTGGEMLKEKPDTILNGQLRFIKKDPPYLKDKK